MPEELTAEQAAAAAHKALDFVNDLTQDLWVQIFDKVADKFDPDSGEFLAVAWTIVENLCIRAVAVATLTTDHTFEENLEYMVTTLRASQRPET